MPTPSGLDPESAARLRSLDRMLRELADDGRLRRQILADLRAPARVVAAQVRAAARGLGGPAPSEWKANAARGVRVNAKITGSRPNVSVSLRRGSTSRQGWLLNKGEWRHPLYGNRSRWYPQRVQPGWFDRTAQAARPRFIVAAGGALEKAADDLAARINRLNR